MPSSNGKAADPAQRDEHPAVFKVIAFKGAASKPGVHHYADPIEALCGAVEYLKQGYQVRMNDAAVAYFDRAKGVSPEPRFMAPAGPAT